MKSRKLSPKEILVKRSEASKYSRDELTMLSKDDVYSLVKGCLPKISGLSKAKLIEKIIDWTEFERKQSENSVNNVSIVLEAIEMFKGTSDYETLLNLWYKAYPSNTNHAANAIVKYLQKLVTSKSKKTVSVINNDYAEIRTIVKSWFNTDRDDWARSVASKIHEHTSDLRALVTSEYTTRKQDKTHLETVDHEWWITECKGILENPSKFNWQWISFALALTSGRRSTEIHGQNRQYELGNDILTISERDGTHLIAEYKHSPTLAFTGAAKTKSRAVGTITIPCLVDPKLWLKNFENLPKERKNCDAKKMKSISRSLSETLKDYLLSHNLVMYKDSRDVYVDAVLACYDESNFVTLNKDSKNKTIETESLKRLFASSILNHKIEAGSTRSYGK